MLLNVQVARFRSIHILKQSVYTNHDDVHATLLLQ